ncbi:hypothetical protein [Endozoicomonas euniceicola]|uniref:Uncharacterized protein n=1 Tax=Endozoicomonas euniceicola TaxID=1234143 RepID=A0ABY6GPC0_9GAMM|nr:hypothetical protein [Endozoicomonas euniceicola]UYM14605.1 hypothetical protein NX720_17130 [Endozoicomonas euniceicola]
MSGDDNKRKGSPSDGSNQNVNKKAKPSQTPQRRPLNQPELTNPSGTDTANRRAGQQTQGNSRPWQLYISNFQIRPDLTLQKLLDTPPVPRPSSDLDNTPLDRASELNVSNEDLRYYFNDYIQTREKLRERIANIEQVPIPERKISDYADEYYDFDGITYGPKGSPQKKEKTSSSSVSSRTSTGTQPGTSGFAYPRHLPPHLSGINKPGTSNFNPRPVPPQAGTSGLNTIMPDNAGAPAYIDLTDDGNQGVLPRDKGPGKAKNQAKSGTQTRPLPPAADQPAQQPADQFVQQPAGQSAQQPAGQSVQQPAGQSVQQPAGQSVQQPPAQPPQQPAVQTNNQDTSDSLGLNEHFRNTLRQLSDDLGLPLDIFSTPMSPDCDDNKRRRRRSACSLKDQQLKKKVTQFVNAINKQTVNFRTKIVFSDSSIERTDISSYSAKPGTVLAEIQNQINDFREKRANQTLDQHTVQGFNSIVVFDKASIPKTINQTTNKPATEVLYFDAESTLLFSKYGEVVTRIPGGEYNRLSLIGTVGDFKQLAKAVPIDKSKPSLLKAFIKKFCHKNSIGNVQIQTTDGTTDNLKSLVQDFESIRRDTLGSIGSISFNSAEGTGSEYRLFPGESNALQVSRTSTSTPLSRSVLPGSFIKLPELDNPPDAPESLPEKVDDKPSKLLTIANTRSDFKQRLLELDTAFEMIRQDNALADNVLPVFDSLEKEGDGWRMDVLQPDTGVKTPVTFTSGALDRFKTFIQRVQSNNAKNNNAKNKATAANAFGASQSMMDVGDMVTELVNTGKWVKHSKPEYMTDSQYRVYLGQQYLGVIALALQTGEVVDLGIKGIKFSAPGIKPVILPKKALQQFKGLTKQLKNQSAIKKLGKIVNTGSKSGRFIPGLGSGLQSANLGLTIAEYHETDDPEMKALLESKVIFESVDTAVSYLSEVAGPLGLIIDALMLFARSIFEAWFEEEVRELYFNKLIDVTKEIAKNFDSLHKYLDPKEFILDGKYLNFLKAGKTNKLLPFNVREINLVDNTVRYGAVKTRAQTHVAGKESGHKVCENHPFLDKSGSTTPYCAKDINYIRYSEPFNMIRNALHTLCNTDTRLTGYNCADGIYKNINLSRHKNILMSATPGWEANMQYSPFERRQHTPARLYNNDSPGALFLDAISDDKLKQVYSQKVEDVKYRNCYWGDCDNEYTYKYIGQVLTNITDRKNLETTSTLHMDDNDYNVFFHGINKDIDSMLFYNVHSFKGEGEGERRKYTLISDSRHRINIYPTETADEMWILAYNGKIPYTCIAEDDSKISNCTSETGRAGGKDSPYITKVLLGESTFNFHDSPDYEKNDWIPSTFRNINQGCRGLVNTLKMFGFDFQSRKICDYSYKVVASDANAVFEFLPDNHKRVYLLKFAGRLRDIQQGAEKFRKINKRYKTTSRFVKIALKDENINLRMSPRRRKDWKGRVLNWFDGDHDNIITLIAPSDEVKPIIGSPETGYYFYNKTSEQVFFKTNAHLSQPHTQFTEFDCNSAGSCFQEPVTMVRKTGSTNKLIVSSDSGFTFQLTADASGKIKPKEIALVTTAERLESTITTVSYNQDIIPLYVIDSRENNNITRAGFYDHRTQQHIAYLNSLFDGGRSSHQASNALVIDDNVISRLKNEHLPIHRVMDGLDVYYILFSQYSGNLVYLKTSRQSGDPESGSLIKKIATGFKVIRPASEQETRSSIAGRPVFASVRGFRDSILAITRSGHGLRIPDDAWSETVLLKDDQEMNDKTFDHWVVEKTGAAVDKSGDRMSLHRFKPGSGVILESLDFGKIIHSVYPSVFSDSSASHWTDDTATKFVSLLKTRIQTLIRDAETEYSAVAGLVKLPITTKLPDHPLLGFMKQQDFWYHRSGALLTADASSQFRIVGSEGSHLITVPGAAELHIKDSGGRRERLEGKHHFPAEFILKPQQARDGHPFCGSQGRVLLKDFPDAFMPLVSVPCKYRMFNPASLSADYQWNQNKGTWSIETPVANFEGNRNDFKLTALDLSQVPQDKSTEGSRWRDLGSAVDADLKKAITIVLDLIRTRTLPTDGLIPLKLRPVAYSRGLSTGWFDNHNKKLYLGLLGVNHQTSYLIGGSNLQRYRRKVTGGIAFKPEFKRLYWLYPTPVAISGLGPFNNVQVLDGGLWLQGTEGQDQFKLDELRLKTFYNGSNVQNVSSNNKISVYLEGNGGSDHFHLKEADLQYFREIIIYTDINRQSGTTPTPRTAGTRPEDRDGVNISLKSPSFLYSVKRNGQDIEVSNRFDPDAARVIIKQACTRLYDHSLVPATIKFADISLTLKELTSMVLDKGGEIRFPMRINKAASLSSSYNVQATGQQPLFIELGPEFRAIPKQVSGGVKIAFTAIAPPTPTSTPTSTPTLKSSVVIPGYAFASGSVMIRQKNGYHILQYDGSRGIRHNLASISLKEQTIERDGHELAVSKTQPVPVNITHVKYVMKEKNDAGYPVVSRHQLDVQNLTLDSKKRYAQVGRNRPDKAGRYDVHAVFYATSSPDEYRFTFNTKNGQLHWQAWRENALTREGVLGKKQASLNIQLRNHKNLASYYKVVPGNPSDLRLTRSPTLQNHSQMVIGGYRQDLGDLSNSGFKPLKWALQKAIRSGFSDPIQGVIFAGPANQPKLSLNDLATRLNRATVLVKEPVPGNSEMMEGNHLDNVIYARANPTMREVRGHGGDDLIVIESAKKEATDIIVQRPVRRSDQCDSRRQVVADQASSNLNFTVNGGAGNDVYVPERNVRINDNKGDHSVFISKTSGADLRGLSGEKSTTLFVDMKYDTTLFSLCDRDTGSLLTLMTKKQVTEAEVPDLSRQDIHVYSTEHNGLVALANLSTLKRIHFLKDNKMTDDPVGLITGRNNVLTDSENSEDLQAIKARTSAARNEIRALPESSADTEIVNRLDKLVESLSAFSTTAGGNSPMPTAPASQNATSIFTSPIVNTTGVFSGRQS